jgi:hypothetical protein
MIKTKLHFYSIFTDHQGGEKAYSQVNAELAKIPFDSWDIVVSTNRWVDHKVEKFLTNLTKKLGIHFEPGEHIKTVEVTLNTDYLFDNQWSTAEGFRLFNKVKYIRTNSNCKYGYWLEQTPEMVATLTGTTKCGYCGHMAPVGEKDFCDKCLSSPHLEEENLHLLRMQPIEEPGLRETVKSERQRYRKSAPLTEQERETLLPKYVEAQTKGKRELAQKALSDAHDKCVRKVKLANMEYDGTVRIAEAGVPLGNVIFYEHTETFCFGWRNSLSDEVKEVLKEKLKDFPYKYELK